MHGDLLVVVEQWPSILVLWLDHAVQKLLVVLSPLAKWQFGYVEVPTLQLHSTRVCYVVTANHMNAMWFGKPLPQEGECGTRAFARR
jgi:hypothetical protein